MVYRGYVEKGMVILEAGTDLPDGTSVNVEVVMPSEGLEPLGKKLLKHSGNVEDLPEDASSEHDFYLYGHGEK